MNKIWHFFEKKNGNPFDKVLTQFFKKFLCRKQLFDDKQLIERLIFQCAKNYNTPARVTR